MTERGLPTGDGPAACPFVAFVDDRDERASSPDHRHRCYAEPTPAPRALAHQEAYCLSSAFPVCPTFQDWARREAARARAESPPAGGQPIPGLTDERPSGIDDGEDADEPVYEDRPRRPAQRNWASPPPWLNRANSESGEDVDELGGHDADTDDVDASDAAALGAAGAAAASGPASGLSGSFADRLVSPPEPRRQREPVWRTGDAWDNEVRDEAPSPAVVEEPAPPPPTATADVAPRRTRERTGQPPVEPRDPLTERQAAPSWERPARLESYPTLRSRQMPQIALPGIVVGAVALVLAAILLFFLPGLLGLGGSGSGSSPSPSTPAASASPASFEPTVVPAATQQIYVVQPKDTMTTIAKKFGVPLAVLVAANKATIPNPDRLQVGQRVIIPGAVPSALPGASP